MDDNITQGSKERRMVDRRQAAMPFDGPDRRRYDRRKGTDHREAPRG